MWRVNYSMRLPSVLKEPDSLERSQASIQNRIFIKGWDFFKAIDLLA